MSEPTTAGGPTLLDVELVAADCKVWSGQATTVVVRTADGDLGILPNHEPVLAALVPWPVIIRSTDGEVVASLNGGFLSVAANRVSLLAESAELAADIDVARAERELAAATDAADDAAEQVAASRLAAAAAHTGTHTA